MTRSDEQLAMLVAELRHANGYSAKLLAERDAALAEVARLSTPPDDAEVAVLIKWLRRPWSNAAPETEHGPIPEWVYALLQKAAHALTRLSHALATETDKREAMEAALREALAGLVAATSLLSRGSKKAAPSDKMFDQMIADYQASAERTRATLATLAKHGSKT